MSPRIGAFTQSRGCKRLPFAVPNPIISNMRSSIIIREACTIGADRAVAICGVDSRALSCRSHFSTRTQPRRLPGAVLTVMAAKKSSEVEPPSKSKSKSKGKTTSVVEKSKVTAPAEPKPEAQARMPKAPETAKSVPPTPASDDVASATKDSASHASDAASMYVQVTEGSPIVKRKPASSGAAALRNGYNAVIKTLPVKVRCSYYNHSRYVVAFHNFYIYIIYFTSGFGPWHEDAVPPGHGHAGDGAGAGNHDLRGADVQGKRPENAR